MRTLISIGRYCLACGTLALASACALIIKTDIDDLKLSDLTLVKADDAPHDPKFWGPQGDRKLLLATLTTSYDLEALAMDNEYMNLHADVWLCAQPDKSEWGFFYFHGIGLTTFNDSDKASQYRMLMAKELTGKPHAYQIWFDYRTQGRKKFGVSIDYNLAIEPSDVCIRVSGGPYMAMGVGLTSREITIPKQRIVDLLHGVE